jgi:hypothetical protein
MWADLRIKIILITAVGSSILLFALYYGYEKVLVDNPLVERIQANENVEQVELNAKDKTIKVLLKDKSNLPVIYHHLINELGVSGYQLLLEDNPSEELLTFYHRAQFIIQEAMHKGTYREMLVQLEELAQKEQIMASFYIDDRYIYLDLELDNSNLLSILPRKPFSKGVSLND